MTRPRPWLLILLAALLYACAHVSWYAPTPLGRVPVLDELENLTLANQIADGALPPEPFYRAMGYPIFLASLRVIGVPALQLPLAALLLGVALHALAAVLVGALARRWFDDARAGLFAGLLCALNPVFVHYATQRLDATLGTVLFLAGLLAFALNPPRPAARALLGATFFWTLAALTRPQFLTVLLSLPVLWIWRHRARANVPTLLAALALAATFFAAQGLWQRHLSGEFRVLPWQGAYNLWAANQPGAHGRYYAQTLDLPPPTQPDNPAKLESFALYARDTGLPPVSIDAMNTHWRARFIDHVTHHPFQWLGQLARKTYAFLNNWEQYNNKTYAFHQARSPWLRWNPLGWGALLVLAVAGAFRLHAHAPATARAASFLAVATAAGVILFFVSARFRLPLTALLCIPAGGALAHPSWFFRELAPARGAALAFALLVAGLLAFSNFDGVRDTRPFIQDHLLLARTSQVVGDDSAVWTHAAAALALDPTRRDATEFLVTSGFNRQLSETLSASELAFWRASAARLLATHSATTPAAKVIAATATRNLATLHALSLESTPAAFDALGALALLAAANPSELTCLRQAAPDTGTTLFLMARQSLDPAPFDAWAHIHQSSSWSKALASARLRLFPPLSPSK